ncbi:TadE/TadG family type IV pilus assembly protein [uncultured Sphingomonas sp.]|uniref:pilus assembly protein n=1 Tax=uncultured Sphingomonas sp. TaxID=158754 RepID=UPI0025E14F7C|nr:TadE/TadG family type IV pilus assembly protein [uncultured Sphingomonas sp.]
MNGSAGGQHKVQAGGILSRLARDRRGNTLAMMAIALVPLVGIAGSAIDTARVYYVKVRLQQACDAGVLAGRKTMDGTDFNTDAYQQAQAFFGNNFKTGMLGSQPPSFVPVKTTENQVAGTASVVVPMTLTKMMGMAPVTLNVVCEAKLEIPNLDVMFVLDTTGSMTDTNPGDLQNKITSLRSSVLNFYDTVEAAKRTGTQVRYGFVPYSSNVNVGMLLKPEWMVDEATYQSRIPDTTTTSTSTSTDNNDYVYTYGSWAKIGGTAVSTTSAGAPENCFAPASTTRTVSTYTDWSSPSGSATRTLTQVINGKAYSARVTNGTCVITTTEYSDYTQRRTETRSPNPNKGKQTTTTSTTYWWNYQPVKVNVSSLKGSGATMAGGTLPPQQIANNFGYRNDITWNAANACIEERQTVKQTSYTTIPTAAYDLDVDMVPTSDPETRWKPWLPKMIYVRNSFTGLTSASINTNNQGSNSGTNPSYPNINDFNSAYNAPCPSPAAKLASLTRSKVESYVNGLTPGGFTHHDIGFLWGTRLLSPTGLFASENASAPNGSAISRHLIFMTDGDTDTKRISYDAYGLSAIDQRRTNGMPTDTDQNTIVANRLSALCTVAKRKNITVWVIAFGTSLSQMLSDCASDGRSFQANNAAQLNQTFSNIAAQIAKLRVSR